VEEEQEEGEVGDILLHREVRLCFMALRRRARALLACGAAAGLRGSGGCGLAITC
jgi:hypothetical protein